MRRGRDLRPDERLLWREITRQWRPLPGRAMSHEDPMRPAAPPSAAEDEAGLASVRATPVPLPRPVLSPQPALERKTARALARGRLEVDATLDLHGLTQAEAHARLIGFVLHSQARGRRLVQIVTGKGRPGVHGEERGVLRRVVPHWLSLPGLRGAVLAFEEAAPHRGGSGALYVRLRRRPGG